MKDDDVFKEIGQGIVILVMLCLTPLFFVWEFLQTMCFLFKKK